MHCVLSAYMIENALTHFLLYVVWNGFVSPFLVAMYSIRKCVYQGKILMARPPYQFDVTIRYDPAGHWDRDWERQHFTHTGTITFLLDRHGPGPQAYPIPIRIPMRLTFPFPPGIQFVRPDIPPPAPALPPPIIPAGFLRPLHPHIPYLPPARPRPIADILLPVPISVSSTSTSSSSSDPQDSSHCSNTSTGRKRTASQAGLPPDLGSSEQGSRVRRD